MLEEVFRLDRSLRNTRSFATIRRDETNSPELRSRDPLLQIAPPSKCGRPGVPCDRDEMCSKFVLAWQSSHKRSEPGEWQSGAICRRRGSTPHRSSCKTRRRRDRQSRRRRDRQLFWISLPILLRSRHGAQFTHRPIPSSTSCRKDPAGPDYGHPDREPSGLRPAGRDRLCGSGGPLCPPSAQAARAQRRARSHQSSRNARPGLPGPEEQRAECAAKRPKLPRAHRARSTRPLS